MCENLKLTMFKNYIHTRMSGPSLPVLGRPAPGREKLDAAAPCFSVSPVKPFRIFRGFAFTGPGISISLLLLLLFATGCSKEARKNRYLSRANADFAASRYEQAEIHYRKALQIAPENSTAIGHLGIICQEQGRLPQALAYLRKATELAPDDSELQLKLCLTKLALGARQEARADAERVLQKQPGQADALVALAETTTSLKEAQETARQIKALRQQDKDRPGYHLALATLYLRQGQIAEVAPELNQALALDPKFPATHTALGTLYWLSNDLARADAAFKTGAELSPPRSPRRLKYAEFKLKTGATNEAVKILEELTHKVPDYLPPWIYLAQFAFTQNRLEECSAFLQKVIARDPYNIQAILLGANVKLQKGEIPQATEELLRLSKVFSHSPGIQQLLARCYLLNGEDAKAEASLKDALALDPNFPEAILALAELSMKKGDFAAAARSLEQLLKHDPELPQAHMLLAAAYAAQKKFDPALAVYRQMQARFPRNPQVPFLMAGILVQQKQMSDARKACSQALELAPDFLPPLELLVDLDLADKQPQAALKRVQEQIERRPKVPELQLLLAKIYLQQEDLAQAETTLLKIIELAPQLQTPYMLLARIYLSSGKTQQALDKLNSYVARTNDAPTQLQIGIIQDSLKNYPAAREAYEKALAANPKFGPALNNLAYLYCENLDQVGKAQELAERARQLYPADPSIVDTLGWVFYRKGDFPKALTLLAEAATAAPNEPEIQYHLGMVRYALGQEGAARSALGMAVKSDKNFSGKEKARQNLAILAIDPKASDPAAQTQLEKRLTEDPNDSIALVRLAGIHIRNGAPEKALKTYEQALAVNPKNAFVLASLARLLAAPGSLKNSEKALGYAKDAHAAAPEDAGISQLLGHLACEAGDYKWAASLLKDAALKLPDQPALFYDLARASYGLGQLSAAETALQNALKGTATFGQADEAKRFRSLLQAYRDPAQRATVAAQLPEVLKADPNYIPALMVNQLLLQGKGDFQAARKTLDHVLAINPLFVPAARDLAILCFDRFPDEPKASELAMKAREAFPDDPNLARVLGILAYRREDYSNAARFLKQSLQSRGNDAELFYYLGMAQYRLKSSAESKQSLNRALNLNLAPQLATEAKRVLGELK